MGNFEDCRGLSSTFLYFWASTLRAQIFSCNESNSLPITMFSACEESVSTEGGITIWSILKLRMKKLFQLQKGMAIFINGLLVCIYFGFRVIGKNIF